MGMQGFERGSSWGSNDVLFRSPSCFLNVNHVLILSSVCWTWFTNEKQVRVQMGMQGFERGSSWGSNDVLFRSPSCFLNVNHVLILSSVCWTWFTNEKQVRVQMGMQGFERGSSWGSNDVLFRSPSCFLNVNHVLILSSVCWTWFTNEKQVRVQMGMQGFERGSSWGSNDVLFRSPSCFLNVNHVLILSSVCWTWFTNEKQVRVQMGMQGFERGSSWGSNDVLFRSPSCFLNVNHVLILSSVCWTWFTNEKQEGL